MKHVVFFSGGIGSWATAKRVIQRHGKQNTILLFTDTMIEDNDLYRFMLEAVQEMYNVDYSDLVDRMRTLPEVGHSTMDERKKTLTETAIEAGKRNANFVWIAEGRDPWDIFFDQKFLGNSRIAQCSHELKQKESAKYIKQAFKPTNRPTNTKKAGREWDADAKEFATLYLGIDWTEEHRTKAPVKNWFPFEVKFPMCEEPLREKSELIEELNATGIETPKLYELGFAHNNCGGFCVRAGQGHFITLLETKPDLFKYHEEREQEIREHIGKDVSILKRVRNKQTQRLTLKQLREEYEAQGAKSIDLFDIGGCGCFVSDEEEDER